MNQCLDASNYLRMLKIRSASWSHEAERIISLTSIIIYF
jgi:hypothetical protein